VSRPKHWVKLWVSWLTTPAHMELSEGALGLGPLLLLLCTWDGEYKSGGWLLNEAGGPMSREALARATHRTRVRLDEQLAELCACKTLVARADDGALGFEGFGHWQETSSAKRMRVKRTVREQFAPCDAPCDAQTVDGRRETVAPSELTPPTPSRWGSKKTPLDEPGHAPVAASLAGAEPTASPDCASPANDPPKPPRKRGKPTKPRADYPAGLDDHLHAALVTSGAPLGVMGPRRVTDDMKDALRKLWAACEPTPDDITHVVAVRAAMTRRKEGFGSLTWDSICVASNFRRWLAEPLDDRPSQRGPAEVSRRPTESGVVDLRAMIRARDADKQQTP
jgi:hypothetical protein